MTKGPEVTTQADSVANGTRRRAVRDRASRQTIADVAREAGVSTASVSRTLSGARPVTQATATAVREASDRLGFRANKVARALRIQSTHMIGLLVPNITYPFFPQLIQAVETELRIDGRGLLLVDSLNDATLEAERVEDLLDRQVDGLIVIPCHRHQSESTLLRASRQTNVVQLDREGRRTCTSLEWITPWLCECCSSTFTPPDESASHILGRTRPVRLLTNARAHTCDTSRGPPTPLAYCLVTSPSTGGWRGHCG